MAKNYARKSGRAVTHPRATRVPRSFVTQPAAKVVCSTPQTQPARIDQVRNAAGGYVFRVNKMAQLRRFLCLGTEGGTYYISEKKLSADNAKFLDEMLWKNHVAVIDEIVNVSDSGIALKNDPAIFALALAAVHSKAEARSYALSKLDKVCRIGTHLFTFCQYVKDMKKGTGWGRGMRTALSRWYNSKDASSLAYQVCKYGSRAVEGELPWSHRDILRKAHIVPIDSQHDVIFNYAVRKPTIDYFRPGMETDSATRYIYGHELIKDCSDPASAVEIIAKYNLARESIPTGLLNTKEVYDELVKNMPYTATMRNLGNMTKLGTLMPKHYARVMKIGEKDALDVVVSRLTDPAEIQKARVHPMSILAALNTYGTGRGFRGNGEWTPVTAICNALEQAFYASFDYVQPTGKNILLGIDMSGSMGGPVAGLPNISTTQAAAVMAMAIARREPNHYIIGFDTGPFDKLGITAQDKLDSVVRKIAPHGRTDCAVPIKWAIDKRYDIDAFVILTDNETWSSNQHPFEALKQYRKTMNKPDAKLIVVAMTATGYTISDTHDDRCLDVAGFDASVPAVINMFIRGEI